MTTQTYHQVIIEGMRDRPTDALAEILDFVLFLRKRTFDREAFEREMQDVLLHAELSEQSRAEQTHLEKEFEGYAQQFPRE
ncbi:MAG: hypothetical protein HY741_22155 [Chloroflexi bacterium]|nr:hypothetical protein [Chloroflexota bacterium]